MPMPTEWPSSTLPIANTSHFGSHGPLSAHLIGVCGAGMKALAELLDGLGWRLSGSDFSPATMAIEALVQRGLVFHHGHSAEHVPRDVECVIYSPAIPMENVERVEAARRGVPQYSYSQMVGRLMEARAGVCIAGTHGKSTTTAMVGWVLSHAGREPSVLVGAELCGEPVNVTRVSMDLASSSISSERDGVSPPVLRRVSDPQEPGGLRHPAQTGIAGADAQDSTAELSEAHRSGWAGSGELFVVESCEFERSFLDFSPRYAAILSVEPDHFDCFADLPSLVQAFGKFAHRVTSDGVLLVRGDCEAAVECVREATARVVTFGVGAGCEWQADTIRSGPEGVRFRVVCRGETWGEVELKLHGDHNVLNAIAATALCAEIGLTAEEVAAGLRSFPGIRRRFEVVGERNGITVISDYAHHPTAVAATLKTSREVFGSRRIWCVFQPHQVSRTLALMEDFATSFVDADEVLIVPVFAARERVLDEPFLASQELVRRINACGVSARFVESLDRIKATLDHAARLGDVLILMGAGDIDRALDAN